MRMICRKGLAVLVSLVIILTMIPGEAVYAADSLSNEAKVYNYLVSKMGLNTAAACGLLANIKAESDFNPVGDGDAGTSFGLFQWHAGRKTSLINYCESNGLDYRSIEGQMRYLEYELKKSYVSVYNYIKGVENTADGAYQAGYHWCYYYEIPADKAVKADRRGEMAKTVYWKKYEIYKGKTIKDESEMDPADYKVSFSRALEYGDEMMVGADVLYMQICLYCLGYSIDADGSYGPQSSGVVKRFQSAHGLEADGVCNKLTWNAIENELFSGTLKITRQPQAVTTEIGKKVTFSTRAAGSTPSYQWYHKKVGASVWTKWEGKSSATVSATSNESWNGMQVRCTVTDSSGATVNTKAVTVTVNIPLSITQQPQSVETAAGESVTFTIAAKGTGLTYQWYYKKADASDWVKWNGHTAASVSSTANESWNGMQVKCTVADSSGEKAESEAAVVLVNQNGTIQQLEITQHPQSVTAHVGDTVKFSVRAVGSGLSYQWYFRKEGANWTKWEGKTSPDISADANESWSGMQVRCMVADSSGYMENSDAATVTMDISLQITQQPQSVTAGVGETVEFAVKASGAGLSYQWYYKKVGASWTKWPGHTTASTSAVSNDSWNGMQVRCQVTDERGNTENSETATITVMIPLAVTQQPQSVTSYIGDTVKFAVKASGSGLSYQWFYRKSGASSWTKWPGHTTATTSAISNDSWNGMQVRCAVTDSNGSTIHSEAATVTLCYPLEITQQPQSVTANVGDTVKFAVKASGSGLSYQWYYRKSGASSWTKWPGHTTATTSATSNESWNGMQVRCTVTDSMGSKDQSNSATVTLNLPLAITQQPQSVTANAGDTVRFAVKANGAGLSYQWYYKKSGASVWSKWAGHTTAATSATANESWNGMQVRCTVTDGSGSNVTSEVATVTVNVSFAITQHPQPVTAEIGDTVTFTVKASGNGLRYQWYFRKVGSMNWTKWEGHTTAVTSATANESWNGMKVMCIVTDASGSRLNSGSAEVTLILG